MTLKDIDIHYDVQLDSNGKDPDSASKTLKAYHQLLWSKPLPNGELFNITIERGYLKWKEMWLGCDSITASFLNWRNPLKNYLEQNIPDFFNWKREYLHKTYTIGGSIIFPMLKWSMNQARGCNIRICDRWDFTLECIRRFYVGEASPLDKALTNSAEFFKLFVDFKNYVDFFLLQDCVDENYNVKIWLETPLFESMPMPKNLDDYYKWIKTQTDFVERRGRRMNAYIEGV